MKRQVSLRRALGLIETLLSVVLVGGLLVVALNTAGASIVARHSVANRAQAQLLAQDLLTEILRQDYEEPVDTPTFGRESSESGGSRVDYDDVDDYEAWTSTPPEERGGTEIPDLEGWERSVSVAFADPSNLNVDVGTDQGVKRITVTVSRNGTPLATFGAVRTNVVALEGG